MVLEQDYQVSGGLDKVLGLCNTEPTLIPFLTFQSCPHVLAHYAPRSSVSTLSNASALCFFHAPDMTHTYVAEGPDDGLGLAVGLISRFRCHKFWIGFLRIASTSYSTSAISGIPASCRVYGSQTIVCTWLPIALPLQKQSTYQSCSPKVAKEYLLLASKESLPQQCSVLQIRTCAALSVS